MREIIFRGKTLDKGEWVYGVPVIAKDNIADKDITVMVDNPNEIVPREGLPLFEQVDSETVGQYTGLTDKNGNKIFEGDIVKDITESYDRYWGEERKRSGIAVVKYGYHEVRSDDPYCYGLAYGVYFDGDTLRETPAQYFGYDKYQEDERYQFEVIGNIYDNPELLKGE